jgi:hypothetical protein
MIISKKEGIDFCREILCSEEICAELQKNKIPLRLIYCINRKA